MIFSYHPETKQINFKELITLSKVTRTKEEITASYRYSVSYIMKSKILGPHFKNNVVAQTFVEINRNIIDGHTIAHMELVQNKIPFIIDDLYLMEVANIGKFLI